MNKLIEILPNIYYIVFNNENSLGYSFCRLQEYYEGPVHKNTIFTLKEYKKWYKSTKIHNKFTYCTDWVGFNIPDYIFQPFIDGKFDPLSKKEQWLIGQVRNIKKPFYVIGLNKKISYWESCLYHEVAHGLFYTNSDYKIDMLKLVDNIPNDKFELLTQYISELGYHESVIKDEIQAYAIDKDINRVKLIIEDLNLLNEFLTTYKKYFSNNLIVQPKPL